MFMDCVNNSLKVLVCRTADGVNDQAETFCNLAPVHAGRKSW
jgi:hypothetical protein